MTRSILPFAMPDITDAEITAVSEVLRSGWITTGMRAREFEKNFSKAVGASQSVAVNSCTASMHLALDALGIETNDEVILPVMTFAATGEVVRYLGAKPVLVEIRDSDYLIDPDMVEKALTEKTKVIIPVHFGGQASNMEQILEIASKHGFRIVEDAAHSFPAAYNGKKVGTIGDITCFSFYATKTITTGEGGMAVTNNTDWADRMRIMSLHGISKDAWKRYTAEGSWYYEIIAPGYKYNMTDIAAAIGLVQLERATEMLEKRRRIARKYIEAFENCDSLELLSVRSFDDHAWHLFVIRLVSETLSIDRNRFIEELKTRGIGTSVHFIPLHIHPYYRDTYGYKPDDFPVALDCYQRSISLPIYSKMSDEDTERVIEAVLELIKKYRR